MMFSFGRDKDSICAISTAPGSGGIAVLRLSGSNALEIGRKVCTFLPASPESHRIYYGFLTCCVSGEKIDEVLVSYFSHGRSFTGEETLEISCHGGTFLTSQILAELVAAGARVAQKGEFTYRAFMNGRLDLVQAEAVLEVINSENKASAQLALRQLEGAFSSELKGIKEELTWILAHLEANIDYAAEDIVIAESNVLLKRAQKVQTQVEALLKSYRVGRILREGISVLLLGEPNAGKSSLLNTLTQEDRAIVTDIPGTTRDIVEGRLEVNGYSIRLMDSAGLRESSDQIELLGMEKTKKLVDSSDLIFWVLDPLNPSTKLLDLLELPVDWEKIILVWSRRDLIEDLENSMSWLQANIPTELFSTLEKEGRIYFISSKDSTGLNDLVRYLGEYVSSLTEERSGGLVNARHLELLSRLDENLKKGMELISEDASPEFIAFELQSALMCVYETLGEHFDDQVMDRVFKEFCLGK